MSDYASCFGKIIKAVDFSKINIKASRSHGHLFVNDDNINIFQYSSTFYFDIKLNCEDLKRPCAFFEFQIYEHILGAAGADFINNDGQYIGQIIPIKCPAPLGSYGDKLSLCIPLDRLYIDNDNAYIRIWLYCDVFDPVRFSIRKIYIIDNRNDVDIVAQMSDFIFSSGTHSWNDTLRPLIDAGWTSLHFTAHWGHIELVERLIGEGVDPNIVESNGGSALHRAAETGRIDIAKLLLVSRAKINPIDTDRLETPLDCAMRNGHARMAEFLISKGAQQHACV